MNRFFMLTAISSLICLGTLSAQTIWTGPTKTFVKTDSADWTLEANQDRITDSVWLTRADKQSLFNIVTKQNIPPF